MTVFNTSHAGHRSKTTIRKHFLWLEAFSCDSLIRIYASPGNGLVLFLVTNSGLFMSPSSAISRWVFSFNSFFIFNSRFWKYSSIFNGGVVFSILGTCFSYLPIKNGRFFRSLMNFPPKLDQIFYIFRFQNQNLNIFKFLEQYSYRKRLFCR